MIHYKEHALEICFILLNAGIQQATESKWTFCEILVPDLSYLVFE